MDNAFEDVKANGIASEAAYPYLARDGKCNMSIAPNFKINGFNNVPVDSSD